MIPAGVMGGLGELRDDELRGQLLTACVLLLLHETPADGAQLQQALAALRLYEEPPLVQERLEWMEDVGLVFSTWGPHSSAPERHTFHIAAAGTELLRQIAGELQSTRGVLGTFLARCEERFVLSRDVVQPAP